MKSVLAVGCPQEPLVDWNWKKSIKEHISISKRCFRHQIYSFQRFRVQKRDAACLITPQLANGIDIGSVASRTTPSPTCMSSAPLAQLRIHIRWITISINTAPIEPISIHHSSLSAFIRGLHINKWVIISHMCVVHVCVYMDAHRGAHPRQFSYILWNMICVSASSIS